MKTFPQSFTSTQGEQSYTMKKPRVFRTSKGNLKFLDAIYEFGGSPQNTRYKSKGIIFDLKAFCLYLKNPDFESIKWQHIQNYISVSLEIGWSEAALVQKLAAIKKFFQFWHSKNCQSLDPRWIPEVRTPLWQNRVIDEKNFEKLIAVIPKDHFDARIVRNLAIISLLWDTRADFRDILDLDLSDIDLKKKSVSVKIQNLKFRKECRLISWSDRTNENLRVWLAMRALLQSRGYIKNRRALFVNYGRKKGTRFEGKGLSTVLFRYCKQANIDYFNPHSFQATTNDLQLSDIIKQDIENIRAWAKGGSSINFKII